MKLARLTSVGIVLAALTIAGTLPALAADRVETMLEEMNEVASTNSGKKGRCVHYFAPPRIFSTASFVAA